MTNPGAVARQLAEIQDELISLPADAFDRRWELRTRQGALRHRAREFSYAKYEDLFDEDLLEQLAALREQMKGIEKQRIDLVSQSGSSGAGMGDPRTHNAVTMNMAIGEAAGLPGIKSRIGAIKGALIDRGVEIPAPD
jgi:hypothetical protein